MNIIAGIEGFVILYLWLLYSREKELKREAMQRLVKQQNGIKK